MPIITANVAVLRGKHTKSQNEENLNLSTSRKFAEQ
jgi:hypothetical protein